jgi:acetylornithine deacetylase
MIAEECTLQITYRPLPQTDPRETYNEIARRVRELDTHDYGSPNHQARIELSEPFIVPPLLSPRETPLETTLLKTLNRQTCGGIPFTTDGCQFAQLGIASLICGPGDLEQAHQPNESIRREAFEHGSRVILDVIHALCEAT